MEAPPALPASMAFTSTITDLVNDQAYYFTVSAVDSDGNEGPRSTVVEARPGVTGGAAALAGDTYGCTCQNVDAEGAPGGLAALPGPSSVTRRPRCLRISA